MATLDYTRRSVKLGNLTSNAKARAPILPDTFAGVDRNHAWERAYARQAQGWDMVADGAAKIGKAIIGLDALIQQRENDRLVSKAAGMGVSSYSTLASTGSGFNAARSYDWSGSTFASTMA